ncbi:uncharacterized protein LOC111709582 [Eurytemora carolleeae]|uniref:uncharacterized protein LOC111709582 n=1 Tax=Eurytemora carolleeae TaxID=1294199 RepID=UPI000C757106|nr:uncharacterized protein LOC111709582 [Eurytemora carolleeae]|eukprot:XP_023339083.1 uncharacterized protein LOC111709582 [Eurytemora affinis]
MPPALHELLNRSIELIGSLALEDLDPSWVQQVWDSEFTQKFDIPVHYEETIEESHILKIVQRLTKCCEEYMVALEGPDPILSDSVGETSPGASLSFAKKSFWSELIDQNVKYSHLIALLSHYIEAGTEAASGPHLLKLGLTCAGLYVSLITLPGSGPYKIFHPVIYSKALQTLQIIKKIPALHGLPRRSSATSSQQASQGRKNQKKSSSQRSSQRQCQNEDEDEEEEGLELSLEDQDTLIVLLLQLVTAVEKLLEYSSMKRSMESLELTIRTLLNLVRLETSTVLNLTVRSRYREATQALAYSSLLALLQIPTLKQLHGDVNECSSLLFNGI